MRRSAIFALCLAALVAGGLPPVSAWGPHSEITRAAIDSLPGSDRLEARLGAAELERYCWIPDYHQTILPDYSPRDYLIFPGFPEEVSHLTPDVQKTYRPFFRRAAQALRTESRSNAARWTGALVHFIEDSGSPPHAFPISGPVHARMENWVDGAAVSITGYHPRRLGRDVETAAKGLEQAMERRIARARSIGERVAPLCRQGDRAAAEPLILQAANDSSEATADLLHTLLAVTQDRDEPGKGRLEVLARASGSPSRPQAPIHLRVLGTEFETFSDPLTEPAADFYRGRLWLRNLPPGDMEIEVSRPGLAPKRTHVSIRAGWTERVNVDWVALPVD